MLVLFYWLNEKERMKQQYGDLTYEDGQQDEWLGRLQQKLGKAKHEVKDWINRL